MKQALRDLLCPQPKSKIKAGDGQSEGTYNFYTSSQIQSKFYHTATYMQPALIFGTGGMASVHFCEKPFSTSTDCLVMYAKQSVNLELIYHYLSSNIHILQAGFKGAGLQHISKDYILDIEIDMPDIATQDKICSQMRQLDTLIENRKTQLTKLDQLVKARFVEMFGEPEINPKGWEQITVDDVCSSIVRGPFGSALKKDFFVEPSDTTYKVYEQKHAIQKSAKIGTYYVTEEKYQELKRFECVSGDILMSCSGTMGELYQLPEKCERGIINQALCKFTLNDKMLPICFLTYMKQTIGNLETKGSGIKNIAAVSYVKAMPINLPPMSVQLEFEKFYKQTDKSKQSIQKSLDELETLKKALMQQYFG